MRKTLFVTLVLLLWGISTIGNTALEPSITGYYTTKWGDAPRGQPGMQDPVHMITDSQGRSTRLWIDRKTLEDAGGIQALKNRRITVSGQWADAMSAGPDAVNPVLHVGAVKIEGGVTPQAVVSGSRPWVTIMCKFADVAAEPKNYHDFES